MFAALFAEKLKEWAPGIHWESTSFISRLWYWFEGALTHYFGLSHEAADWARFGVFAAIWIVALKYILKGVRWFIRQNSEIHDTVGDIFSGGKKAPIVDDDDEPPRKRSMDVSWTPK